MRPSRVLLLGLLVTLLAGCSVIWPLAASTSDEDTVIHLPTCSTRTVERVEVQVVDGFVTVWEIRAARPNAEIRDFVVGQTPIGFSEVVPLRAGLEDSVDYSAEIIFGGSAGPTAEVRFKVGDLADDTWWSEGASRTRAQYEKIADDTGLCGGSDFSFKGIFWGRFGASLGLAIVVVLAAIGLNLSLHRRQRSARPSQG
jgi:hypothetical protein